MGVAPLDEGTVVGGRYRVGQRLGAGGMGIVCRATDLKDGRSVALKFLRPDGDEAATERLLREASAAASLRNEHVARWIDVGRLDSGLPFLVMELLEGKTVDERAKEAGSLPVDDVVRWVLEACEGIAEAHARGIVHRDLKPANLFLAEGPHGRRTVKVLDFGVSKFVDATDSSLTTTGNVVGSPSFAAPEQLMTPRAVGSAADVWALGVTLYALLGNQLPFVGETRVQVCMLVLSSTPVPLEELRPEVPTELARVVTRCLEKEAAQRYASVGALAAALAPFTSGGAELAARVDRMLEDPTQTVANRPPPAAEPVLAPIHAPTHGTESGRRENRRLVAIALTAALAVGAVVTAAILRRPRDPGPEATAVSASPRTDETGAGRVDGPAGVATTIASTGSVAEPTPLPRTSPNPPLIPKAHRPEPRRDPKSYR
jgi:serine/threonine-protein kinase